MGRIAKNHPERGIKVSISGKIYAQLSQFPGRLFRPSAVGGRARRARVEDAADGDIDVVKSGPGSALGESADAHYHLRSQMLDRVPQRAVADLEQRPSFIRRQLFWGPVAATLLEKGERTVVGDEEPTEEMLRGAEDLPSPTPEPSTADLRTGASEARHLSFRMFVLRSIDLCIDPEPVSDSVHFAKRHPSLGHPPRPRIHPQEQHFLRGLAVEFEVPGVGLPRVVERVIDVGHRRCEPEAIYIFAKPPGDIDEC
jgi:hypothetical protein